MGPEGGGGGGRVVAEGPPERIVEVAGSYTAEYLKPKLQRHVEQLVATA
jgi:excinuclease ABC subunit A